MTGRGSRIITCALALSAAVVLSACGARGGKSTVADTEAFYVKAGQLVYQVQLSRELNPYATEDKQYLVGLPAGTTAPKPDEEWFAIFLWAKNDTHHAQTSSDSFDVVDTQGNTYHPLALNATVNPYAWTAQTLQPNGTEPAPDTTASTGPTQGEELLFKINDSAYSNRPLILQIHAAGQAQPSTVSLDL